MLWRTLTPLRAPHEHDEQRGLRRPRQRRRRRDQGPRGGEIRRPLQHRHRRDQGEPPLGRLHPGTRRRAHLAGVPVVDARRRLLAHRSPRPEEPYRRRAHTVPRRAMRRRAPPVPFTRRSDASVSSGTPGLMQPPSPPVPCRAGRRRHSLHARSLEGQDDRRHPAIQAVCERSGRAAGPGAGRSLRHRRAV